MLRYPLLILEKNHMYRTFSFLMLILGIFLVNGCAQKQSTPEAYVFDASITTHVKSVFFQENELNANRIHVQTENQKVYLTGSVLSEDQIDLAKNVAMQVENVSAVKSSLNIQD